MFGRRDPAGGRQGDSLARRRAAGWHDARVVAAGLALWVAVGWALVAMVVVAAEPVVATATPRPFLLAAGQTARIRQPGMPDWPIPVEREAFEMFARGMRESDETGIDLAFAEHEWLRVSHGQRVRVIAVDGEAVEIELLDGRHPGRRGWVRPRHLGPP